MPAPDLGPLVAWGRSLGLNGEPEQVAFRPWSTTARLEGVWLKACGRAGRYEARLRDLLCKEGAPSVVLPVAVDVGVDSGFVALPHAGVRLRDVDGGAARWPRLLAEHAALQRSLQECADDAVARGVPDLRPRTLPDRLRDLVDRQRPEAGLRRELEQTLPALVEDCAASTQRRCAPRCSTTRPARRQRARRRRRHRTARLVDWGDSCVGHPFGVLLVTLGALRHRNGLSEAALDRLRDGYLEAWSDLGDLPALRVLAAAAQRVQVVGRALSWERALAAADDADRAEWGDPVTGWLEVLVGRG